MRIVSKRTARDRDDFAVVVARAELGRIVWRSAWARTVAVFITIMFLADVGPAYAQVCESNQAQLTQAITDSQSALDRVSESLNVFGRELISARTGPVDATNIVAARGNLDAFVDALTGFSDQVDQIGQSCGPQFAADAQSLAALVNRFEGERSRADQLLASHQALIESGEPPMSQAEMEAVQRALGEQGFYQGGVDGRFGPGTRAAISAYQQARGDSPTGYVTADQLTQIAGATVAADPDDGTSDGEAPTGPVAGLPPAPDVGAPPLPETSSNEAQQICIQNIAEVNSAVQRTRDFREQVATRIAAFRRALRGPRIPAIDDQAGTAAIADVDSYISALESFYDQAGEVVGQCGGEFDDSFETLTGQLDSLRTIRQRAGQLNADYTALISSGEPAMTEAQMKQVQTGLANLDHYSGSIDALFGPGTRNAIKAYQASIGAPQSGYLSASQIASLEQAAVRPPPTVSEAPVPPDSSPAPASTPLPPQPDLPAATSADVVIDRPSMVGPTDARARLIDDLGRRQPPLPVSAVRPEDGRFGELWWRSRDNLARGLHQETVDQRLTLFGAAYLDRGADSLSMADAHLVIGDAFARLGLFGDAAFHLQRAHDTWSALDRDDSLARAMLLERVASARLAQAAVNGAVGDALFDELRSMLQEALAAVDGSAEGDDDLRQTIVNRLADLFAAAGAQPDDPDLANILQSRYPG